MPCQIFEAVEGDAALDIARRKKYRDKLVVVVLPVVLALGP